MKPELEEGRAYRKIAQRLKIAEMMLVNVDLEGVGMADSVVALVRFDRD
jgi:hypothetical protein